jgi:hypothetical protein
VVSKPAAAAAAAAGCCSNRLAEKIRAARVNKERSLQLQEKAALAAQEAEYDRVYDKVSTICSSTATATTEHRTLCVLVHTS